MICHYYSQTNVPVGSISGVKRYGGCSLYVFLCHDSDDSWTPRSRCRKMFAGWAKLYHRLLPVGITGPEPVQHFGSGNWTVELQMFISVSCPVMIWVSFLLIHRIFHPNKNGHLILFCYDNLSLKKHIIGNNRVVKWVGAVLSAPGTGSKNAIDFFPHRQCCVALLTVGALLLLGSTWNSHDSITVQMI